MQWKEKILYYLYHTMLLLYYLYYLYYFINAHKGLISVTKLYKHFKYQSFINIYKRLL